MIREEGTDLKNFYSLCCWVLFVSPPVAGGSGLLGSQREKNFLKTPRGDEVFTSVELTP